MRGCFPQNNIELQIQMDGQSSTGDSYHYQDIDNYVKKNFTGQYDPQQKRLLVKEGIVTTYHIPFRSVMLPPLQLVEVLSTFPFHSPCNVSTFPFFV